jgi:protein-tyrosine phosphatase
MSYVELHFHLLPGVDDGPASIEQSLELAVAAVRDGTRVVVATPHVHPEHITEPAEIPARVRELKDRLAHERIELAVRPGGELAHGMVARLGQRELEAIAQGPPGWRWVLLEGSFAGLDDTFRAAADELRSRGFAVVVAHPERFPQTPATQAALEHELAAGSILQLTAWSFLGLCGEAARTASWPLLRAAPRAVIASDAHSVARPPALRPAVQAMFAAGVCDAGRYAGPIPRALLDGGLAANRSALVG